MPTSVKLESVIERVVVTEISATTTTVISCPAAICSVAGVADKDTEGFGVCARTSETPARKDQRLMRTGTNHNHRSGFSMPCSLADNLVTRRCQISLILPNFGACGTAFNL